MGLGVLLGLALGEALGDGVVLGDGETVGLGGGEGLEITGRLGAAWVGGFGAPPKGAGAVGLVTAKATISPAVAASAIPTGTMRGCRKYEAAHGSKSRNCPATDFKMRPDAEPRTRPLSAQCHRERRHHGGPKYRGGVVAPSVCGGIRVRPAGSHRMAR